MASSTASSRSGSSLRSGTWNGMPASRILFLARTSRWAIVVGETRNAEPIAAASKPRTVCRISGARTLGVDRRMGAGEHQGEALVGHLGLACRGLDLLGHQAEVIGRLGATAPAARGVDLAAPRHRHQPRLGSCAARRRSASRRGRGEGFRQRILGAGDVAGARREERDELAVAAPRDGLGGLARLLVGHRRHDRRLSRDPDGAAGGRRYGLYGQTGRTSTVPRLALGHRAAHTSAVSRSGTSMMWKPPSCSFASAYGPSTTCVLPSTTRTLVVADADAQPLAADVDPRLLHRLGVGRAGRHAVVHLLDPLGVVLVDQQHVLHVNPPPIPSSRDRGPNRH